MTNFGKAFTMMSLLFALVLWQFIDTLKNSYQPQWVHWLGVIVVAAFFVILMGMLIVFIHEKQ